MSRNPNWTEEELILALCLYYELPSGQHHQSNKEVENLATKLGRRTPSSVAYKLGNFKSLDDRYTGKGMTNHSKQDENIWNKYLDHPAELFERRNQILARYHVDSASEPSADYCPLPDSELDKLVHEIDFSVEDRKKLQNWRESQWAFRLSLLKGYDSHCCLSGISNTDFLVASHIVPWSIDKENRLNPRNGLLLNVFLDKAFDKGYISIRSNDYKVLVSPSIRDEKLKSQLVRYEGQTIALPRNPARRPDNRFLEYHNDVIFRHHI